MREHHRPQHDVLGQLVGFRFHHVDRVGGAGHDHVEIGVGHLFLKRVQDILTVDISHPRSADRAHKGNARNRQRGGRTYQRRNVRIIFQIMRHNRTDHLRLVTKTAGEERPQRPVN